MSPSKPSANVFGTFLESVSTAPSRSAVDLYQITKQAIEWSNRLGDATKPEPATSPGAGPVEAILRSIADAKAPLSFGDIVKATGLSIDATAAALRDATTAGLANATSASGAAAFDLTPAGRDVVI